MKPGRKEQFERMMGDAAAAAIDWAARQGWRLWAILALGVVLTLGKCGEDSGGGDQARKVEPVAKPGPVAPAPADRIGALIAWSEALAAPMRPCEQASQALSQAMSAGQSRLRIYELAVDADTVCGAAANAIEGVARPAWLSGEAATAADKARDACESNLLARAVAADRIKTVVDGDLRPSAMAEAKQAAERVEMTTMGCAAAQLVVVDKAGVALADYTKASAARAAK